MKLILNSPLGAQTITFVWPLTSNEEENTDNVASDIIETMKWVCVDLPELTSALRSNIICHYDVNNQTSMIIMVKRFNKMIDALVKLEKGTSLPYKRLNKYPSRGLLRHILQQTYNRAVEDPEKLNRYEPFSPEVYGETSYDFVCEMIDRINVTPDDVFIDLGSGVGQVVLQMAAGTQCKKCIGIERAKFPNEYADNMSKYFRAWMEWYGKKFGEYTFIKGDFLMDKYRETISQASIVFVNNFAFGPNVDHQLKELFAILKDGTRIVSSRSFCSLNSRITSRNVGDICSIMHVCQLPSIPGSASWTGKPVPYYLHIIDRSKLENYFQRMQIGDTDSNSNISNLSISTYVDSSISSASTSTSFDCNFSNVSTSTSIGSSRKQIKQDFSNLYDSFSSDSDFSDYSDLEKKKLIKEIFGGSKVEKEKNKQQNKCRRDRAKKTKSKKTHKIEKNSPRVSDYVDQQLPNNSKETVHVESDEAQIPPETYVALENLLDVYRGQFIQMIEIMKNTEYKNQIESQIKQEKEKNQYLQHRAVELEEEIQVLTEENVVLMKSHMKELNINVNSPRDLVNEVSETVCHQKELQAQAYQLQKEVDALEKEQAALMAQGLEQINEKYRETDSEIEMSQEVIQRSLILREISFALEHRNKLHSQVTNLENEIFDLEKTNEERKQKLVLESKKHRSKKKQSDNLLRRVLEKKIKMEEGKAVVKEKKTEDSNKNLQKHRQQFPKTSSSTPAEQVFCQLPISSQTQNKKDIKQKETETMKEAIHKPCIEHKKYEHMTKVEEQHHVTRQITTNIKSDTTLASRRKLLKKLTVQQQQLKGKTMDTKTRNYLKIRETKASLVTSDESKINKATHFDDSAKDSSELLGIKELKNLDNKGEKDETKLHRECRVYMGSPTSRNDTCTNEK